VIRTTVIGSHPVVGEGVEAIKKAVNDQLEAGINIISDGQTRKDMVAYYADHIPGFKVEEGRSYIVGKVSSPEETPVPKDLLFVKKMAGDRAEVKSVITGPVTMVFFSELGPSAPYKGFRDEALYRDVSEALAMEAELTQKEGLFKLQIDEPSFSIGAPMSLAKEALERTIAGIKGIKALHVCGNLKRSFTDIVKIEGFDVLSFAFKDSVSNFDTVQRRLLEDYSKKLGVGCVSSSENKVEEVDTIRGVVQRALDVYGVDNIAWIHPDCGLRSLEREAVKSKLKNMVLALNGMESELE
jgi:5-methyltetrahydropteroyltriglutamate--homocysteine methyltransferase